MDFPFQFRNQCHPFLNRSEAQKRRFVALSINFKLKSYHKQQNCFQKTIQYFKNTLFFQQLPPAKKVPSDIPSSGSVRELTNRFNSSSESSPLHTGSNNSFNQYYDYEDDGEGSFENLASTAAPNTIQDESPLFSKAIQGEDKKLINTGTPGDCKGGLFRLLRFIFFCPEIHHIL